MNIYSFQFNELQTLFHYVKYDIVKRNFEVKVACSKLHHVKSGLAV